MFTCIESFFQINVAFASREIGKNIRFVGTCVFVAETPQKGKEQAQVLEFRCLQFCLFCPFPDLFFLFPPVVLGVERKNTPGCSAYLIFMKKNRNLKESCDWHRKQVESGAVLLI